MGALNLQDLKMADQKKNKDWKAGPGKWRTKSQGWKMQDLENDGPGYIKKRAGVESSLVVDIKRKKAVTLKNVHGATVSTDQAIKQ